MLVSSRVFDSWEETNMFHRIIALEDYIAKIEDINKVFSYWRFNFALDSYLYKRWPEMEKRVSEIYPYKISDYIDLCKMEFWPEAEKYIAKDSHASYIYTVFHVKGRWSPGEKAIFEDPYIATEYAKFLLSLKK